MATKTKKFLALLASGAFAASVLTAGCAPTQPEPPAGVADGGYWGEYDEDDDERIWIHSNGTKSYYYGGKLHSSSVKTSPNYSSYKSSLSSSRAAVAKAGGGGYGSSAKAGGGGFGG